MQPGTPSGSVPRRKLIEVSLPLEDINAESAREKSIRHGHPSTLHLWWARRPLAAARAVLFAQLVDDPSSHPELFATEEEQKKERERLHRIIRRLVVWENISDEGLYREAREEIFKSTGETRQQSWTRLQAAERFRWRHSVWVWSLTPATSTRCLC